MVVSRYAEDVAWLSLLPFKDVIIYDKNDNPDISNGNPPKGAIVKRLPNVGRCDHTYLHHIITNYDQLADVTLFTTASCPNLEWKWKKLVSVIRKLQITNDSVFPVHCTRLPIHVEYADFKLDGAYVARDPSNAQFSSNVKLGPSPIRPFGAWYAHMFGRLDVRAVTYHGIFAVSAKHVRQRPIEEYQRIMSFVTDHSNPEAGHYIERSWHAIFKPIPTSCHVDFQTTDWIYVASTLSITMCIVYISMLVGIWVSTGRVRITFSSVVR